MKKFRLKMDHVRLLRRMYVGWQDCETGAPEIDPKRPYGNSDVANDMAVILGLKSQEQVNEDPVSGTETETELLAVHRETETALQIVLSTGSFDPGDYKCDDYGHEWVKA